MNISRKRGVTLIELIVVIAITGIVAAAVALFIRRPVEAYVDTARRAALTDAADTALRRITRDLRLALPNSVRVLSAGSDTYIEYIETKGGGRYRAESGTGGNGNNILNFTAADDGFDVLGPVPSIVAGADHIVVYNLYSSGTTSNAYAGDNRSVLAVPSGIPPPDVAFASKLFPTPSPGKRFHVVSGPVTYGCTGGQLVRYWGYPYSLAQAVSFGGGSSAVLATNVDACEFVYTTGLLSERIATVSMIIQVSSQAASGATERVRMFQQAQVSNTP